MKIRIKTAKNRKLSSTRWLYRHLNDQYVHKTNKNGYRSRSAYKLIEIDEKFKLIEKGQKLIDLGASPGGWSQVASEKGANIVAIDIRPMSAIHRVKYIQCNVHETGILMDKLKKKFEIILSDMSPESCGLKSLDHIRIMLLCEAALNIVKHFLNRNGKFVVKVFQGESDKDFYNKLKKIFNTVKYFKPKSSRCKSKEIYLVCLDFAVSNLKT